MRRNYRNLFMVGVMAFATCLTSCKKDEGPTLDITVNDSEELAEEIRSTSATFTLKTSDVDSVAYYVEKGAVSESDYDATVLYATAREEGRVVPVVDGDNKIAVYSLEGNTEYTAFFVYAKDGKFVMKSKVFTTPAYDRLITVVESAKDGWKFHFNVPDSMYYMYAFTMTEWYNSSKTYGHTDITFLMDGKMLKGPQTVEIHNGDYWNENYDPEWDSPWYIHPGSAYTLLMAECDADGNILYEVNEDFVNDDPWMPWAPATRAGTATAPRMGEYTEEPNYDEAEYATGKFARQFLLAALEMVDSKINVELTGKTERRIKVRCTTEDDVQYVVAPMMKSQYNEFVGLVGKEAVASTLLEYYRSEAQMGTQDFEFDENYMWIELDSTYVISVVGIYEEDGSVLSYDSIHVTLTKSTLPAAEVTITGIENAETPNLVWFNVKSEKQNVVSAKHIANYTKEVQKMINDGYTYEDLINQYGEYLSQEDVNAINSAEGLTLSIYSFEDMESTLLIGAFNEEEGLTAYAGVSRSAEMPALEPVNSTLFDDLKGDWNATIVQQKSEQVWYEAEDGNWYAIDSIYYDTLYTSISLGTSFDNAPATFDASHEYYANVYDSHFNNAIENGASEAEAAAYATEMVANQFNEYKAMVAKYENKYKGQNYILGTGFDAAHEYASPWDLFCATNYTAYDVEELFYAYGPKLFFQVQQDGSLQLLGDANIMSLPPVSAWGGAEFVVVGNNPADINNPYNGAFPVEISDDKNTLVIKGVDNGGQMCYPAIGYWNWGWLFYSVSTCEDIVLTRAEGNDNEGDVVTRAAKLDLNKVADVRNCNNRIKRIALPEVGMPKAKTVEMNYVPVLEKLQEKFNKYNERMSK